MADGELDGAVVMDFPLRGEWVAYQSPAMRIPSHGTDLLAQRYAFDFLRLGGPDGARIHPAGSLRTYLVGVRTRECFGWGEPVRAPQDGEVVAAADGVPERGWIHPVRELAGIVWTAFTFNPARGFGSVAGNHVILRHGDVFSASAHLGTGSVAVSRGDHVRAGDVIGRVGHTGNSTAPHLHFQLMDGPDPVTAAGVPCAFRGVEVRRGSQWLPADSLVPTRSEPIRSVA